MTQTEALRLALEALEKLWNIIDDIDTYSDMAKADEKLYRSLVERRQRQRFEETGISTDGYELHGGAITAIKVALEANEFNPDWDTQAVLVEEIQRMAKRIEELEAKDHPQYIAFMDTPQRTWVGLTDAEIEDFVSALWPVGAGAGKLLRAIEAKLKEKNT
jgi:hypothetical protein